MPFQSHPDVLAKLIERDKPYLDGYLTMPFKSIDHALYQAHMWLEYAKIWRLDSWAVTIGHFPREHCILRARHALRAAHKFNKERRYARHYGGDGLPRLTVHRKVEDVKVPGYHDNGHVNPKWQARAKEQRVWKLKHHRPKPGKRGKRGKSGKRGGIPWPSANRIEIRCDTTYSLNRADDGLYLLSWFDPTSNGCLWRPGTQEELQQLTGDPGSQLRPRTPNFGETIRKRFNDLLDRAFGLVPGTPGVPQIPDQL